MHSTFTHPLRSWTPRKDHIEAGRPASRLFCLNEEHALQSQWTCVGPLSGSIQNRQHNMRARERQSTACGQAGVRPAAI